MKSGKISKDRKSKESKKTERKAKKALEPEKVAKQAESNTSIKDVEPSPSASDHEDSNVKKEDPQTFQELGLIDILVEACETMKFKKPTPIQAQSIPYALEGRDIMGLAATGSGKTAAFALPILQDLYNNPAPYFSVVMSPTRELAQQIAQQFEALGSTMGLRCAVIIGGEDLMTQSLALSKKPHVIVATPGRLLEHLEKTKGFSLRTLKYLVLDEADRLLDMDFKEPINRILTLIPRERHTYLFSATPSKEVEQLKRASLSNPVLVKVNQKITTVDTLVERMVATPPQEKDAHLVTILNEIGAGKSVIVFSNTKEEGTRIPILLDLLEFPAIPINGNMTQNERQSSLNRFKSGAKKILVATNVAARGLDIPQVDIVLNYQVPENADDYIHRVGRTARAGRSGLAITFVSQYDLDRFVSIENTVHPKKNPSDPAKIQALPLDREAVAIMRGSIDGAQREAKIQLRELAEKRKNREARKKHKKSRSGRDNQDEDM